MRWPWESDSEVFNEMRAADGGAPQWAKDTMQKIDQGIAVSQSDMDALMKYWVEQDLLDTYRDWLASHATMTINTEIVPPEGFEVWRPNDIGRLGEDMQDSARDRAAEARAGLVALGKAVGDAVEAAAPVGVLVPVAIAAVAIAVVVVVGRK